MLQYRFWMKEVENEGWMIFLVVDSESDYLPVGATRAHWNEQALKEKDREIAEIKNFYGDQVRSTVLTIRNNYKQYVKQSDAGNHRSLVPDP